MYKTTLEYRDFNNKQQKEDLYFNLTEAEIVRLDVGFPGGLIEFAQAINADTDKSKIMDMIETVLEASYGIKSEDGKRFVKNHEVKESFLNSAAYSALFVKMMRDTDFAAELFNALVSRTTLDDDPVL